MYCHPRSDFVQSVWRLDDPVYTEGRVVGCQSGQGRRSFCHRGGILQNQWTNVEMGSQVGQMQWGQIGVRTRYQSGVSWCP